jgi:hypothetical protein
MKEKSFTIAMISLVLYFLISQIIMVYFWYLIAQSHGFLYSLFIGPFEAELKGLLWPFFI